MRLAEWSPQSLLLNPAQTGGMSGAIAGALQQAPQYTQQLLQNQNQAISNQFEPATLGSSIFEKEMFPLGMMSQSPMMLASPAYRNMWAQGQANAFRNSGLVPNAQPTDFGPVNNLQNTAYSQLNAVAQILAKKFGINLTGNNNLSPPSPSPSQAVTERAMYNNVPGKRTWTGQYAANGEKTYYWEPDQ